MTKSKLSKEWEKRILVFSFTIIPVLLLLVFSYYPLIKMIQYSLTDWNGYSQDPNFVGLDNYKTVLTNPNYFSVFKTSLYYFIATFFQLGIALLFATILLNGVAIGFIFLYFYKGGGTLDTVLKAVGLGDQIRLWLGDRSINNISLAFTSVWRYTGFNFLVFLGAIQSINPEVYEAAEIDGANRWDQFRYIIIPSIRNIVFLNIILGVSGSLSVFDIPYIMTGGSNETSTFVIQTIDTAFKYNKVGLASAMAIILLFIVIVVSLIQKVVTSERKNV